ncbi:MULTISPECIES: ATP-grasp domain-containing protein [unclassified Kitasatospora]|uniref:ATP-grasp domain-containing protein n=1 Tax=unclassified Kitasatospora TaxID=2633591 RepID=UPI00070F2B3A|nr:MULTISPECIES: ATP-grasp domain-containing protein [unclassified Kitasatospora]KQV17153.1 biotin carboxylase [Kitasatospora sp. Root107]KRB70001.1 biotin carboxylase [Kitasatospora sp. Root187]
MSTPHQSARPVLIVGYVAFAVPGIAAFQEPESVVYIEEPDVARKRHVAEVLEQVPFARGLIEWEYHLPGRADSFFAAHPGLDPVAVIPAVEYAVPFAARLAERYGLPGASLGAAQLLRDKHLLRTVAAVAGIANPASEPVGSAAELAGFMTRHPGPVVLKPTNRQASVGTRVVHRPEEAEEAWAQCQDQDEGAFVPDRPRESSMLAERFVSGPEFSVEMLVAGGRPVFANTTGKVLYPGAYPIEAGHTVPAELPEEQREVLVAETERLSAAVGFGDGVLHCEWILEDGVPVLVECAGRLPGDSISDLIEAAYPVELVRAYFALMSGEPLGPLPERAKQATAARFLAPDRPGTVTAVHGLDAAAAAEGVQLAAIGIGPGHRTAGLRSSWDRVGIVTTLADTPAEARRLADEAAALVRIELDSMEETS